ncbi:MAG: AraC family transcriptional regulator [Acidobacteriota bacterium]
MSNKQSRSNRLDLQLNLNESTAIKSHRKMELLSSGTFLIEDIVEINGSGSRIFVMCNTWLIELFELEAGEFSFIKGKEYIRPSIKRFGIFYPPFAIMQIYVKDVKGHWTGMAATEPLPEKFMTIPMIFETDFKGTPKSVEQVKEILDSSYNRQSIEINPTPSLLSLKAKRLIDENYLIQPSIARIAARLDVTHAHLTRQFTRDFGLNPSAYCHQLRIADATFRLASGEEIIDVSQEVGYNDLSRFYKQFSKATRKPPGYCQASKKRHL